MNTSDLARLVHVATRTVLDRVSYTTCLPEWQDPVTIDFEGRERLIAARMAAYLAGKEKPRPVTRIAVPRKRGDPRTWTLPTVNDQIILHVCASGLATALEGAALPSRAVYSYRLSADASRLAFVVNQIEQWSSFEADTADLVHDKHMLQLDLQDAFGSIDFPRFLTFFRGIVRGDRAEIDLLELLLGSFGEPGRGLPLINDSLFYLGNAYLTVVDQIVDRYTSDYVRFVDDYRIFDPSRPRLERIFEAISADLVEIGFRINPAKVYMGDEVDYARTIGALARSRLDLQGPYGSTVLLRDLLPPSLVAGLVARLSTRPAEITDGMGRYVMQAVRRISFNDSLARERSQGGEPLKEYRAALALATPFDDLLALLLAHAGEPVAEWRLIWLLFVAEGFAPSREALEPFFAAIDIADLPPVARCWSRRLRGDVGGRALSIDDLHDMTYVEAGKALYGV